MDALVVVESELIAVSVDQVEVLTTIFSEAVTVDVLRTDALTETLAEVVCGNELAVETVSMVTASVEVISETMQTVETLDVADAEVIADQQLVVEIITECAQGLPGPAGIPGPAGGSVLQRTAGETVSALRVLYEQGGKVYALDYRDGAHIDLLLGVSLTAADTDQPLTIQRSGVLDDSGWSWALGRVWLGINGALTQTPPPDGYDVLIGAAVSATRITLNIQDPIELE